MERFTLLLIASVVAAASPAWAKKSRDHHRANRAMALTLVAPPLPRPMSQPVVTLPPPESPAAPSPPVVTLPPPESSAAPSRPAAIAALQELIGETMTAQREVPVYEPAPAATSHFVLGLKAGGLVGATNGYRGSSTFNLEGGYVLPALDNRLQVYGSIGYTAPQETLSIQGGGAIPGGAATNLSARQLWLAAGLLGRLMPLDNPFNAYAFGGVACIGSSVTSSTQSAGSVVGSATYSAFNVGAQGGAGIEIAVGPGNITLEGAMTYVPVNNALSGPTNAGGFTAQAGYRYVF